MKNITVRMTLEWTFNKKDWSEEKNHLQELVNNPNIVLGYDTLNSLFMLNDLDTPKTSDLKVYYAD